MKLERKFSHNLELWENVEWRSEYYWIDQRSEMDNSQPMMACFFGVPQR